MDEAGFTVIDGDIYFKCHLFARVVKDCVTSKREEAIELIEERNWRTLDSEYWKGFYEGKAEAEDAAKQAADELNEQVIVGITND